MILATLLAGLACKRQDQPAAAEDAAVSATASIVPAGLQAAATEPSESAEATSAPATATAPEEDPTLSTISIESAAFGPGQPIPRKYTGDGQDISPPLQWSGVPGGTAELVLIVDDPDAPSAEPWVHWVLYDISPDLTSLPENIVPALRVSNPGGLLQGKNSWGKVGYGGPSPPAGRGRHRYFFKLYALDQHLTLQPGKTKADILAAMQGHILAWGELVGTYERP